jgi:hypothetical protein
MQFNAKTGTIAARSTRTNLDTVPTPSPRLSGERAGARGFDLENNGSSPPALSSSGEEREKNRVSARILFSSTFRVCST